MKIDLTPNTVKALVGVSICVASAVAVAVTGDGAFLWGMTALMIIF